MKKLVTIHVEYYKNSGKYYSDEQFEYEFTILPHEGTENFTVYMPEVTDFIRKCHARRCLPGLTSGQWEGPIRVTTEHGYPCLIMDYVSGYR